MPLPSDLPATVEDLDEGIEAARRKYAPLVGRLGTVEFLGLMDVVTNEVDRRQLEWRSRKLGSTIGR